MTMLLLLLLLVVVLTCNYLKTLELPQGVPRHVVVGGVVVIVVIIAVIISNIRTAARGTM